MGKKLFRKRFFGYKISDVKVYFETASKEYDEKILAKDEEIKKLREELNGKEEEIARLLQANSELEEKRETVARAIIQAEENAAAIIEEAKKNAVLEKQKVEAEIEAEKDKLRSLNEETAHLKRTVTALINRFTGELDEFASE